MQAVAWLATKLVLCTSLRYMLLDLKTGGYTCLLSVSEEAPPPTMVLSVAAAGQVVLLMVRAQQLPDSWPEQSMHHGHQSWEHWPSRVACSGQAISNRKRVCVCHPRWPWVSHTCCRSPCATAVSATACLTAMVTHNVWLPQCC